MYEQQKCAIDNLENRKRYTPQEKYVQIKEAVARMTVLDVCYEQKKCGGWARHNQQIKVIGWQILEMLGKTMFQNRLIELLG